MREELKKITLTIFNEMEEVLEKHMEINNNLPVKDLLLIRKNIVKTFVHNTYHFIKNNVTEEEEKMEKFFNKYNILNIHKAASLSTSKTMKN